MDWVLDLMECDIDHRVDLWFLSYWTSVVLSSKELNLVGML